MEKKELEELRNNLQEVINCIDELLAVYDTEDEKEKEQKLGMLFYKLINLNRNINSGR